MKKTSKVEVIPRQIADVAAAMILKRLKQAVKDDDLHSKLAQKILKEYDITPLQELAAKLEQLEKEYAERKDALIEHINKISDEFNNSAPEGFQTRISNLYSIHESTLEKSLYVVSATEEFDIFDMLIMEEFFNPGADAEAIINKITQDCLNQLRSAVN